ncbi:MAG: cytochrome c oxidase accessory protein CcoG [Cyclobacteriaceae bacterium]|nr:cytochrome c oxidase accessory protein CcoG [Cyclobacteriaceae bacterium]
MENFYEYDEQFRDTIGTVDKEGKRIWVYPKKPKGSYHTKRAIVAIVLLGLLFSGPFIKIGGQPLLLFNIFERKFVLFGIPFWPQDFYLFGLAMITFFVFIILFTVVFGRVWCGWACPQTIFMELVFRKIEYWIDGDAAQQRKLKDMPWNTKKITKRVFKYAIFLAISLLIAHTLMAYLIGIDNVVDIVTSSPYDHWSGFIGMLFFTAIFFWVFSYFREQACIAVCPYGRLQGVLLNKDSMAVSYDFKRGEPRGRIKKGEIEEGKGDCIDCKLCVHVCPTGIDIRNGTQLECVNCTACMDACDEVMTKVDRPKGLVRIASYNNIVEGTKKIFTGRVIGYTVVLAALLVALGTLLSNRTAIDATALRVPGQLYQKNEKGDIQNLINILFINKSFDPIQLSVKVRNIPSATIQQVGKPEISLGPNSTFEGIFFVTIPLADLHDPKTPIIIDVYKDGEVVETTKTNFLAPFNVK